MADVQVIRRVLNANDVVASENRDKFKTAGALAINLISSPGSGKTTLLEQTIDALNPECKSSVLVGDLETTRDADRLSVYADKVVQINTGMSCHLYANQIAQSLDSLDINDQDYVFIENVGNMVCPGEFDLGENLKATLYSIPEGDDKVAKYPTIFRAADVVLLTKIDLIEILDFDLKRVYEDIRKLNSEVKIIELSSIKGIGMQEWLTFLKDKRSSAIGAQAKFITE